MYGSAAGTRNFHKTSFGVAAYNLMSSTAVGGGERSPRDVLIVTGKNVRYVAIIDATIYAGRSSCRPHITTMGARARIGTVWLATMRGMNPRSATFERTKSTPNPKLITAPATKPTRASPRVISEPFARNQISGAPPAARRLEQLQSDVPHMGHGYVVGSYGRNDSKPRPDDLVELPRHDQHHRDGHERHYRASAGRGQGLPGAGGVVMSRW